LHLGLADGLPRVAEMILNAAMILERTAHLGAAPHQRSQDRNGYANGFKPRTYHSAIGKLDLRIPQTRDSDEPFRPSLLESGSRTDKALKAAIAEIYLGGTSTRKVSAVMEKLCGLEVTSTQVWVQLRSLSGKPKRDPVSPYVVLPFCFKVGMDPTFAAEGAFEGASQRLLRHHGVSLSAGCVRKITLEHARAMDASETPSGTQGALPAKGAEALVAEMDGSMLPIVETGPRGKGRKQRKCHWKEYRLCAARCRGEAHTHYGVSAGEVDEAGFTLARVAARAGWALDTKLQCVADGAEWIQRQWRGNFGTEARFLLDLYHLCEYLAAAKAAHTHGRWLEVQKARLKRNRHGLVLKSLRAFAEPPDIADEEVPVRAANTLPLQPRALPRLCGRYCR
jgi:hypothetical protein